MERPKSWANTPHGKARVVKVALDLIQQNIKGNGPVAAVEDQHHAVIIEIDGLEEHVDQSPVCVLIVDAAFSQRVEKGFDLRFGKGDQLAHLNGKLALQFVLLLFRFSIRSVIISTDCPRSNTFQRFSMAVSASCIAALMRLMAELS